MNTMASTRIGKKAGPRKLRAMASSEREDRDGDEPVGEHLDVDPEPVEHVGPGLAEVVSG